MKKIYPGDYEGVPVPEGVLTCLYCVYDRGMEIMLYNVECKEGKATGVAADTWNVRQ